MNQQKQKLADMTFFQREYMKFHHTYDEEMYQYQLIREGNIKSVKECTKLYNSGKTGRLSEDPVKNLKYLFVSFTTLTTRFCIEGGMPGETAYSLSDLYIQQMDKLTTETEIIELKQKMVLDFTTRMAELKKEHIYAKPVILCIDYIYYHLHKTITVAELADYVNLTPSYLSSLFKKETGISISSYIRKERIESAKNMLKYSNYSYLDISNYLAFSSHSHFSKVFKEETGYSPKEYRNHFFRHSFNEQRKLH